jgi:hypothetical protein
MVCAIIEVVRLPNAALPALPNDSRNAASSLRRAIAAPSAPEIRGREEEAPRSIADQLRYAVDAGRNAGNFHRHGFHKHHRDSFGKAGEGEDVGGSMKREAATFLGRK